jgi:acetyltransferase
VEEIDEMLGETRVGASLASARGARPGDRAAVVSALAALARLVLAAPGIQDVEVNPLRCASDGVLALDARVLVA